MRIVITGMGAVSSLGYDVDSFVKGIHAGTLGFRPIRQIPEVEQLRVKIAAEVPDYDENAHFTKKELALYDRFTQFQLLSAREAIADAGLEFTGQLAERTSAIMGSGIGGQTTQEQNYKRLYHDKAKRLPPLTVPKLIPNAAVSHVTMEFGIKGPSFTIASACASAAHSMAQACMMLRTGLIDVAVTGGSEACITFGTVKGWEALRVVSNTICRPFSKDRSGMILGEGSGTIILETLEHAQSRGAKIYAEVLGFGMSSDAGNIVQPSSDGAARAMKAALKDAQLNPEDVQYINAHGTGTPQNDPSETAAIREVFGSYADKLAVSSTKSMHGHALGAAAALETIAVVSALERQAAPPTMNYTEADPKCDLDYVPNKARPMEIEVALNNSFAFGGLNAALVFKRFRD